MFHNRVFGLETETETGEKNQDWVETTQATGSYSWKWNGHQIFIVKNYFIHECQPFTSWTIILQPRDFAPKEAQILASFPTIAMSRAVVLGITKTLNSDEMVDKVMDVAFCSQSGTQSE